MQCFQCKGSSSHWWKKGDEIICDSCYNALSVEEQQLHMFFIPE